MIELHISVIFLTAFISSLLGSIAGNLLAGKFFSRTGAKGGTQHSSQLFKDESKEGKPNSTPSSKLPGNASSSPKSLFPDESRLKRWWLGEERSE